MPRLMTPSSCGKGLGSGWAVAVAGGKGGEPRALAVPPLTHSPVETETFPRLTPPAPQHPGLTMAGCTCKHPCLPWQHPRHTQHGRSRGSHGWALLSLMQGCSPSPPRAQPGWLGARSPAAAAAAAAPSPGPPLPQDGGSRALRHSARIQTLLAFMERQDQGGEGASPPPDRPTKRAFRALGRVLRL